MTIIIKIKSNVFSDVSDDEVIIKDTQDEKSNVENDGDVKVRVVDASGIQTDSESLSFIESGRVKSDSMMI